MLVLTRRIGQEIVIDGAIRITITAIDGNKVRIGITAPPAVRVDRAEVHRRRQDLVASVQPIIAMPRRVNRPSSPA